MNPLIETDPQPRFVSHVVKPIAFSLLILLGAVGLYILRGNFSGRWLELAFVLNTSAALSIVIWQACDPFADAAQWVGCRLKLPSSVRGATLDAIASSMPELFTGIFFVLVVLTGDKTAVERLAESSQGYGSTIATCAGSSIYNMILIPAICAIVVASARQSKPFIEIDKEVISRDGTWVIVTQFGLLIFLFQPKLDWWMAVVALVAYLVYVAHLYWDTRKFRRSLDTEGYEEEQPNETAGILFGAVEIPLNGLTATVILVFTTLIAAGACWILVEVTNESAHQLGVEPFFVAVILTAAVSSIPDTFVSMASARRGDDSGAISNVFGSNIFDICIGMSIPLIVCCYLNDWQPIELISANDESVHGVVGLRVFLFLLTAIAMFLLWKNRRVGQKTGWFFCVLYASFVLYAVYGALQIGSF